MRNISTTGMIAAAQSSGGGAVASVYPDDVFLIQNYTGDGTSTKNVLAGLDWSSASKWAVWGYNRIASSLLNHIVVTDNAITTALIELLDLGTSYFGNSSNYFGAPSTASGVPMYSKLNANAITYSAFGFLGNKNFFSTLQVTSTGSTANILTHGLSVIPGMVIMSQESGGTQVQLVYHRGLNTPIHQGVYTYNSDAAFTASNLWGQPAPTTMYFTVNESLVAPSGLKYRLMFFAHDPTTSGICVCDSFTTDASGNATVELGWEPQWMMLKPVVAGSWMLLNNGTGLYCRYSSQAYARVNAYTGAETAQSTGVGVSARATGFDVIGLTPSVKYLYTAIRRPYKKPAVGSGNYFAQFGSGAFAATTPATIVPDFVMQLCNTDYTDKWFTIERWPLHFLPTNPNSYAPSNTIRTVANGHWDMYKDWKQDCTANVSSRTYFFRRAQYYFEIASWLSHSSLDRTVNHGLGVVPEMIIYLSVSAPPAGAGNNYVYHKSIGVDAYLNTGTAAAAVTKTNATGAVGASSLVVPGSAIQNPSANGIEMAALMFATLAGVSFVGGYTGDGAASKVINCGFTAGAKLVIIKRTDAIGPWYVLDSASGFNTYNTLNDGAGQVSPGSACITSDPSGFVVGSGSPIPVNVSGATYAVLAIA